MHCLFYDNLLRLQLKNQRLELRPINIILEMAHAKFCSCCIHKTDTERWRFMFGCNLFLPFTKLKHQTSSEYDIAWTCREEEVLRTLILIQYVFISEVKRLASVSVPGVRTHRSSRRRTLSSCKCANVMVSDKGQHRT